ncbi:MAG: hypothetical protein IT374_27285 [Polyangiaceae bacterium]|nr:hypothetical protein [Polyangiaceae bacterium]
MRRLAVYAHYDADHEVKPYVSQTLASLARLPAEVVFVSTSALPEREQARAREHAGTVILKENIGLDFGMWKRALERVDLAGVDELVLTNSSVLGPLDPGGLARAFDAMARVPCDFWGMSDSHEIAWHVMSYFVVLRRPTIEGGAVSTFFEHVLPMRNKSQIIRSYEVGLSSWLLERGHPGAVVAPIACLPPLPWTTRLRGRGRANPTIFHPLELLDLGCPFVKVELLRDNPAKVDLPRVRREMARRGYDLGLVDFIRRT